jgi:outer membrane protein assembly factor BamB
MSDKTPQTTSTAPQPKPPRRKLFVPPRWIWILWTILCIVVAVARGTDILQDHGIANIVTFVCGVIAATTLSIWFLFSSAYRLRARLGVLAVLVLSVTALAVCFKLERVNGELVPVFAYRFSAKNNERLPTEKTAAIDLRTTTADDFPQFLGPRRSDSVERPRLKRNWAEHPPELVWRHEIGAGWSAFSVVNGHAVTMEQRGELEMVTCYNVLSGGLEWSYSHQARFNKFEAGLGPRSTPTIDQGMVFALGALGQLVCLDGSNGKLVWEKDLLAEGGVTRDDEAAAVPWGRSNSPLVVGDCVIVPLGGKKDGTLVTLVAYDKRDGRRVWQGGNRQLSYSSPSVATLAGKEQILSVNEDTISGHDLETGKPLWEQPFKAHTNTDPNVSQAVPIQPDRVFVSKGYGGGALVFQLVPGENGEFTTKQVWKNTKVMKTKFTNVAVRDHYAYGLSDGILECIDLKDGKSQWKDGRYEHGQILLVNDAILVLTEKGEVVLVAADPAKPNHVLGRFQAIEGLTWNNFALAGPYLLVRNAEEAACYKLPTED